MAIMGNPLFEHDHDFFSAPEGNPYCWIAGFSYDICCVGFGAGSGRGNGGALGASDGLLACVAKSLRSSLQVYVIIWRGFHTPKVVHEFEPSTP